VILHSGHDQTPCHCHPAEGPGNTGRGAVKRTTKPVHGTAKLVLFITGVPYAVRNINPTFPHGNLGWSLTRADKDVINGVITYQILQCGQVIGCSCADFTYRRGNDPHGCKHIAALRAVGLLPPEPVPLISKGAT